MGAGHSLDTAPAALKLGDLLGEDQSASHTKWQRIDERGPRTLRWGGEGGRLGMSAGPSLGQEQGTVCPGPVVTRSSSHLKREEVRGVLRDFGVPWGFSAVVG